MDLKPYVLFSLLHPFGSILLTINPFSLRFFLLSPAGFHRRCNANARRARHRRSSLLHPRGNVPRKSVDLHPPWLFFILSFFYYYTISFSFFLSSFIHHLISLLLLAFLLVCFFSSFSPFLLTRFIFSRNSFTNIFFPSLFLSLFAFSASLFLPEINRTNNPVQLTFFSLSQAVNRPRNLDNTARWEINWSRKSGRAHTHVRIRLQFSRVRAFVRPSRTKTFTALAILRKVLVSSVFMVFFSFLFINTVTFNNPLRCCTRTILEIQSKLLNIPSLYQWNQKSVY